MKIGLVVTTRPLQGNPKPISQSPARPQKRTCCDPSPNHSSKMSPAQTDKKKSGLATTLAKVRGELSVPPQLSLTLLSVPKTEFEKRF